MKLGHLVHLQVNAISGVLAVIGRQMSAKNAPIVATRITWPCYALGFKEMCGNYTKCSEITATCSHATILQKEGANRSLWRRFGGTMNSA